MTLALRTECLFGHSWAMQRAAVGILEQGATIVTQLLGGVLLAAVERNHIGNDASLVLQFTRNFLFVHHPLSATKVTNYFLIWNSVWL